MVCGKAEGEGGLPPVKDDNAAARHFIRQTLAIFNRSDYAVSLAAPPPCSPRVYVRGYRVKKYPSRRYTAEGTQKIAHGKRGPPPAQHPWALSAHSGTGYGLLSGYKWVLRSLVVAHC